MTPTVGVVCFVAKSGSRYGSSLDPRFQSPVHGSLSANHIVADPVQLTRDLFISTAIGIVCTCCGKSDIAAVRDTIVYDTRYATSHTHTGMDIATATDILVVLWT